MYTTKNKIISCIEYTPTITKTENPTTNWNRSDAKKDTRKTEQYQRQSKKIKYFRRNKDIQSRTTIKQ